MPSPRELDAQSSVHIDEWVDVGSDKFKRLVEDPDSLFFILSKGINHFLFVDVQGRIWGKRRNSDSWYPFHDVVGGRTYGWKLSTHAPN